MVYTSAPLVAAQKIASALQAKYGITVELFRTGGVQVLRRFMIEQDAGRPGADGTFAVPSTTSAVKGARYPNAAKLVAEFSLSQDAQKLWPESGIYAARTDVAPPVDSPPIASIKVSPIDYDYLKANTAAVKKRFSEIFSVCSSFRRLTVREPVLRMAKVGVPTMAARSKLAGILRDTPPAGGLPQDDAVLRIEQTAAL